MTKVVQRPQGMSQLDYLWLNFGGYQIGNSPSSTPQQNVILNELAVTSLIKNATNGGILNLQYKDHPTDSDLMQLVGTAIDGQVVSFVDIPKEVRVQSFTGRTVTQVDIDNGCKYPYGSKVLSIVLTNGKEFLVDLNSLDLVLKGAETKTTISEIIDGKVYNHVKIDKVSLSVIELKETSYGVSAHLNISPDKTGVKLSASTNGLKAEIPFGKGNIKFDRLSLNAYMALENKDDFTVYFITDKPYIFIGSQKFGVDIDEMGITSLNYNPNTMVLTYQTEEGIKSISLGASLEQGGTLSKEDYVEFQRLKNALNGIVSVKEYLTEQINGLGASISYGDIVENKRPLYLKNKNGDVLSTVWTDVETYLSSSMNKTATIEDVTDASKTGVALEVGDKIIILSLTNGNKHYIKLQDLVVSQSFSNTNTIKFTEFDNKISADLALVENKIVYVTESGLTANLQIKRDGEFIKIFGRSTDDKHLIGKFLAPKKELINGMFISNITEEFSNNYPPSFVNWKKDETVVIGNDYYILFYKDYITEEVQYYYINMPKPTVRIANIEGNLLKANEDGELYVLFEWIEQTN